MHKISKEQMNALNGSIEKWDKIRNRHGIDRGLIDCPLCQLYNINENEYCKQCVIYLETGERFCKKSPYKAWIDHHKQCHLESRIRKVFICSKCDTLANDEYEFLKELKTRCVVTWWKTYIDPIIVFIRNIICI